MRIDAVTYRQVARQAVEWARNAESRTVCCATVQMVMETFDRTEYRATLDRSDIVTPDGMPLVWALRFLGLGAARRTYGPDLTRLMLSVAERKGIPVGFHGASHETLCALLGRVEESHPRLRIVYRYSPPFRQLSELEREIQLAAIHDSGARFLFVGLGCPKQEKWVVEHRGRIPAVMFAVGAAFDFLAGTKPQAPRWMMGAGLEWLFRLASEPGRLWARYLKQNPRFVAYFALQLLGFRLR